MATSENRKKGTEKKPKRKREFQCVRACRALSSSHALSFFDQPPPLTSLSLVYWVIAFRLASKYCSLGHDNKAACPLTTLQQGARTPFYFVFALAFLLIKSITQSYATPPHKHTRSLSLAHSPSVSLCLSLSQSLSL